MTRNVRSFLGQGWSFPPRFASRAGGAELVETEEDIRQALQIVLSTFPGERVMRPEFGLNPGIFSTTDETSINDLKARIAAAIARFEPRVRVVALQETVDTHGGRVDVSIDYEVPSVNSRGNLVFPFYLPSAAPPAMEKVP